VIHGSGWPVDGSYHLRGSDYLLGMLIETSKMYLMMPSMQILYVYIENRGVIRVHGEFSRLEPEQLDQTVEDIRSFF
jgi:hypothetical protein